MRSLISKKYKFILLTIILVLSFYSGFKTAIKLRSYYDQKLIPNFHEFYTKYDHKETRNIYLEGFLRYMSLTKQEYNDLLMETYFELETKPFLKWFIEKYIQKDDKILDIGGATGIQWKKFYNNIQDKNAMISVVDIDKKSIEWGRKYNQSDRVKFFHTSEVDKIKEKIFNHILFCQVYMQIPNANKLLKDYADKYPNAKIILIQSAFPPTFMTKILNFLRQHVLKYTYLAVINGRAMTDKTLYSELKEVNLKVIKEIKLDEYSYSKRAHNTVKAYIIRKS